MRRVRDNRENETLENAQEAYERYANCKHHRWNVMRYEQDLKNNTERVLREIIDESFVPSGYREKWIFDKKPRKLAKAPVYDHHAETAHMLPYEKDFYDHVSWRAPAVRPGLGTHAMMRYIRNDLQRSSQEEVYYYVALDIHHYFPLMDHQILKEKINGRFKEGKFRRFVHRVIDSYRQGCPLGIKLAQLLGMLYLADFDRLAERFFDITRDPEKMEYWTSRYITEWILTAKSPGERTILSRGTQYLAARFRMFASEGLLHYYRFVDNIIVMHEDKTFLRIVRDITIMILTRDYRTKLNTDYNVRPTWMGIRLCGYTYFHDHTEVAKRNKQVVARNVKKLQKKGYDEEQIRIRMASQFGFIKHADTIHFFKTIGMDKSLGKIIKNRRATPPFKGMSPSQKVPFSSLVVKITDKTGGVETEEKKIYLLDYTIMDSKIEKETVSVREMDSEGNQQEIRREVPGKVLAIRFKKILKTIKHTVPGGEPEENYIFEKKLDENGNPTDSDAEYYAFTGSKIMIDQAENDFTPQDLPAPTVIAQKKGADGKYYTKFT